MKSQHDNGEKNTTFKGDLEKLRQAYDKLDREGPPELLDQAVLNLARREVEKKSHWTQFGWLHGLTTAAVFVLAFSIILHQRDPSPVFESDDISTRSRLLSTEKTAVSKMDSQADEAPVRLMEKREKAPGDPGAMQIAVEEVRLRDSDSTATSPAADRASDQAGFMAVAEPVMSGVNMGAKNDTQAEQKLAAIISLKQAGDESWRDELKLFQEQFPDYPLPDELKN